MQAYLEKNTGEIWLLAEDVVAAAEDGDESSIYESDEFEAATRLSNKPDDFIMLPDKYDLNEYSMMEDFCHTIKDADTKQLAFIVLQGKGAFRRFKDFMIHREMIDEWYKYRGQAIEQEAITWCENNDIQYER